MPREIDVVLFLSRERERTNQPSRRNCLCVRACYCTMSGHGKKKRNCRRPPAPPSRPPFLHRRKHLPTASYNVVGSRCGQIAKFTSLFHELAAKAGGVAELEKSAAGLSLSGLPVDTLMKIWMLSDLDGNDRLCLTEYLICCFLIAKCVKDKEPPPGILPPELASSARAACMGNGEGEGANAESAWALTMPKSSSLANYLMSYHTQQGASTLSKVGCWPQPFRLTNRRPSQNMGVVRPDGDDRLSRAEYLICCFLIARCVRQKEDPPSELPQHLSSSQRFPQRPQSRRPRQHLLHHWRVAKAAPMRQE